MIVAAAFGLLLAAVLALGIGVNVVVGIVQLIVGLPTVAWIVLAVAGPVALGVWMLSRRR